MERKSSTSSKGIPLDPEDVTSNDQDQTWQPDHEAQYTVTNRTEHDLIVASNQTEINANDKTSFDNTQLSFKNGNLNLPAQNYNYMSSTMMQLRKVLEDDDSTLFERLCVQSQIYDQEENLMLLYVAAICMNSEQAFDSILARTDNFKIKSDWNFVFTQP